MILALLLACGTNDEATDDAVVVADDAALDDPGECERDPPLAWDNFGQGFFTRYCTSCHSSLLSGTDRSGAPVEYNFETEQQIAQYLGIIRATTLGDAPTMPPGGSPTATELSLLDEWLTCSQL